MKRYNLLSFGVDFSRSLFCWKGIVKWALNNTDNSNAEVQTTIKLVYVDFKVKTFIIQGDWKFDAKIEKG